MAESLRELRRAATQLAIRQAITATEGLPIGLQRSVVSSLVTLIGSIPMLRWKVRENMRLALDALRKDPSSLAEVMQAAGLLGKINSPDQIKRLNEWADCSLLPPFEVISKYFYFSVYAGSFNADGFQMDFFSPTPPKLK